MLAEVARQVLHGDVELEKFARCADGRGRSRLRGTGARWCPSGPSIPRCATRLAERVERGFVEAQRLADFARGGASAIGDDVGGHGGAELAVALVDVLDDALALVAAGQVDIDVGPFAALFGEEALEQQLHADRIDGGDAERVADGAVGGRAAALHEDVLLAAEADDVPDDEEVAGQLELLDEMPARARSAPAARVVIRERAG